MCQLSPVAFHGDTIFCVDHHGEPFVPMKPIVENMGMGWASQSQKLNENQKRWTVTMIVIVAQDGKEREMLCLPLRKLAAWLASINPKKVRQELRAKIELYQAESDDALWNYWFNGKAERVSASADAPITAEQQCTLRNIVDAKVFEITGGSGPQRRVFYMQIWNRFKNHFRLAKYDQLPQSKIAEAISYLVRMEVEEKSVAQQEELPKAEPVSPYQAYLEEVEKVRQKTMNEMSRLMSMGLNLLDVYKFTTGPYHMFTHILNDWLARVIVQPSPIESKEQFDNSSPVALIRELSNILPSLRK